MRNKLIELRGERTQDEISKDVGISQKTLSAIERGYRNPSVEVMKKLQEYFGVSMVEIFPDIFLIKSTTKRGWNRKEVR